MFGPVFFFLSALSASAPTKSVYETSWPLWFCWFGAEKNDCGLWPDNEVANEWRVRVRCCSFVFVCTQSVVALRSRLRLGLVLGVGAVHCVCGWVRGCAVRAYARKGTYGHMAYRRDIGPGLFAYCIPCISISFSQLLRCAKRYCVPERPRALWSTF